MTERNLPLNKSPQYTSLDLTLGPRLGAVDTPEPVQSIREIWSQTGRHFTVTINDRTLLLWSTSVHLGVMKDQYLSLFITRKKSHHFRLTGEHTYEVSCSSYLRTFTLPEPSEL